MALRSIKFIFFCLLFISPLGAMTTSVIVPCYYKHFQYLEELLHCLSEQTQLPNEVVVSLSEAHRVSKDAIKKLRQAHYPFTLKLLTTNKQLFAGENRNQACRHATGDIFICQDADDIPHPQRIEIITYFFNKHDIPLLLHKWVHCKNRQHEAWRWYKKRKIPLHILRTWAEHDKYQCVHSGNCALKRSTFKKVQWTNMPRGQDTQFNERVMQVFQTTMIIDAGLIAYDSPETNNIHHPP